MAHPRWPDEARIALSLVVNYEEGAEACVLHGDAHSESVLTDLGALDALPGARNLNVESNFEYGSRVGFWELLNRGVAPPPRHLIRPDVDTTAPEQRLTAFLAGYDLPQAEQRRWRV